VLPLIQNITGVTDAKAERVSGLPQITVRYDKDKLALYGLNVGDLNKVIRIGFAGETAGMVYEGEKRFNITVRLAQNSRQDISNLKTLFVTLPSGSQIPLEQVADIAYEPGPQQISRENGKRRITIGFNVRGRDVQSVVKEIQQKLETKLKLPAGYYLTYGGQFENLVEANKRLSVAVPVALLLIFVLLFFTFNSIKQSLLIYTAIPFSAIGGIWALWLRDMPFSISAGVGFIALFGVAVLNGIVLIGYFNQLKAEGMTDVLDRIREGTKVRLRPVVMTASVASLGFLPMALSHSAGAEVQKPLATVVIGGLITATLLTLIVLPILYYVFEKGIKRTPKKVIPSIPPLSGLGIFLLFFSAKSVQAQQSLNLNQAIALGQRNNLQIQADVLYVQMQNQLKGTTKELPKTNIVATIGQYNTRRFDQNFSISQSFSPFLFQAKKVLLAANIKTAEHQQDVTKQETAFQIRQSWQNILYGQQVQIMLLKEDSILQGFIKAASLRFKTGETNALEKVTATTRQQDLQQQIKQNEAFIAIEKAKLKVLINLQEDFLMEEKGLITLNEVVLSDSTLLRQNPILQLALQQIVVAEATKKLQQAELKPEFTGGYFLQSLTGNQDVNNQTVFYNGIPRFQGITLGVALPIFGKSANKAKMEAAKTHVLLQQKTMESQSVQLQGLFVQEVLQLNALKIQLDYYQNSALPNAALISQKATKAYLNGDISYVEYLQSFQTSRDIQHHYLETLHKHNQSVINLQFLLNQ
jgi:heavy metal efflux system protein